MKYQTGSYAGSENLLQVVREKLVAEGWTVDLHAYVDSLDTRFGKRLHVRKDGVFLALRNFDDYNPTGVTYASSIGYGKTGIDIRICTGFDAAQPWYQQPGYSSNGRYVRTGTAGVYHLFTSGTRVLLVAEFENERYSHVLFGKLSTHVDGTGGDFMTGIESANNNTRNVPFDHAGQGTSIWVSKSDYTGWLYSYQDSSTSGYASSISPNNGARIPNFSPSSPGQVGAIGSSARSTNRLNGLSALMPIYTYVKHQGMWSPFAEFEDLFFVNCDLFVAEQNYVIGDRTFKVFPFFGKEIPSVVIEPFFGLGLAVLVDA